MTESSIMAPVSIADMRVTRASLSVDEPAESMRQGLNVTFNTGDTEEDEERGEYSLVVTMDVKVMLTDAEDDQDVRAEASARVVAIMTVPMIGKLSDRAVAIEYLKRNGASMTYAHARSYLMAMTSMSPTGAIIIPPILPDYLIKSQGESNDAEEVGDEPAR